MTETVEDVLEREFKRIIGTKKIQILSELRHESPDFILLNDGKRVGVELKGGTGSARFAIALGQLLFGKTLFQLDELWLILPSIENLTKEWFQVFEANNIKIFCIGKDDLVQIRENMLESTNRMIILRNCILRKMYIPT